MTARIFTWLFCLVLATRPGLVVAQETPDTAEETSKGVVHWVMPAGLALFSNAAFWAAGRFVLDAPYSRIGIDSVERNFTEGFEWDVDAFSTNQLGHPYQGGLYFNGARANGHGFWVSSAYALFGSLQWEMFMENELPSYNDVVTTTFGGVALGEALFRLSSAVLDDSSSGWERAGREVAAGVLAPTHGLARVLHGQVVADGSAQAVPPIRASVLLGPDRILQDATEFELRSLRAEANVIYGDHRLSLPDDLAKVQRAFTTEQYFLVWSYP